MAPYTTAGLSFQDNVFYVSMLKKNATGLPSSTVFNLQIPHFKQYQEYNYTYLDTTITVSPRDLYGSRIDPEDTVKSEYLRIELEAHEESGTYPLTVCGKTEIGQKTLFQGSILIYDKIPQNIEFITLTNSSLISDSNMISHNIFSVFSQAVITTDITIKQIANVTESELLALSSREMHVLLKSDGSDSRYPIFILNTAPQGTSRSLFNSTYGIVLTGDKGETYNSTQLARFISYSYAKILGLSHHQGKDNLMNPEGTGTHLEYSQWKLLRKRVSK